MPTVTVALNDYREKETEIGFTMCISNLNQHNILLTFTAVLSRILVPILIFNPMDHCNARLARLTIREKAQAPQSQSMSTQSQV